MAVGLKGVHIYYLFARNTKIKKKYNFIFFIYVCIKFRIVTIDIRSLKRRKDCFSVFYLDRC